MIRGTRLAFKQLEIRRMPGFPRGGFTLGDLSPGINVIYGPNGSGKSTSARAMHALLWPDQSHGNVELYSVMSLGDEIRTASLEFGHIEWQRAGSVVSPPPLPPADGKDRYMLELIRLLVAEDESFAAAIAKESMGGYDVDAAAAAVGFSRGIEGKRTIPAELRDAKKRLEMVRREEDHLVEEEQSLDVLRREKEQALRADFKQKTAEYLIDVIVAQAKEQSASNSIQMFPDWMDKLNGNEIEILDELAREKLEAEQQLAVAAEAKDAANHQLESTGLGTEGISDLWINRMEISINEIGALERELLQARRRLDAATETKKRALERLHGDRDITFVTPESVDRNAMTELESLAEMLSLLDATEKDLRAEKRRLESLLPDGHTSSSPELLERGSTLLLQWLKSPEDHPAHIHRRSFIILGLSSLGWVAFGVFATMSMLKDHKPLGIIFAVIAVTIVALVFVVKQSLSQTKPLNNVNKKAVYEQDFKALGLSQPDGWMTEEVFALFNRFQIEMANVREQQGRFERLEQINIELKQIKMDRAQPEKERALLVQKYGLPPEERAANLWWIAQRLSDIQRHDLEAHTLSEEIAHLEKELARHKEELGKELASFDLSRLSEYGGLRSIGELGAMLNDLKRRREQWVQATHAIKQIKTDIKTGGELLNSIDRRRVALFRRLGMTEGDVEDETRVRKACDDLSSYRVANEQFKETVLLRQSAEQRLKNHLPTADMSVIMGRSLCNWTLHEAEQVKEQASAEAEKLNELSARIMSIEHRIQQAKGQNKMEQAISAVERAENDLIDLFEDETRMEIGKLIAEFIKEETRERDRPEVFMRAREHFARITRGAYTLEIDDGDVPVFRAIDSSSGEGKSLNQLSGGTRAQLLIAVRIAFVESQESGISVPVIFDEALANSDDERAEALIQAVIDLAMEGRQVFYMTAQLDEVAKWKDALNAMQDVPHRIIDLAEVRHMDDHQKRPFVTVRAISEHKLPVPDALDYVEYGRRLDVPGINPYVEDVGYVHLWHLLDDPTVLHQFLSARIETWGQLRVIHDHDLLDRIGEWAVKGYKKAEAAARCLTLITSLRAVGRGRPFDRDTLVESGAVSDAFLENAYDIAVAYDFDAKAFIEAIDDGELKRFREDNKKQLRTYLEEHGYLDERDPYDEENLATLVRGGLFKELSTGLISGEHVERLIFSVLESSDLTSMQHNKRNGV